MVRVFVIALLFLGACAEPTAIGRKCYLGDIGGPDTVTIAPYATECESRICLNVPRTATDLPEESEHAPLCSAMCETDADCEGGDQTPCQTGFTCQIPAVTGKFRCMPLCVCRDYLTEADMSKPAPAACE